jgi:hypothetical protein
MSNKGLIFIPDISGFSRFVTGTEIEHSRQIIQELLESLINANSIGLQVSEIEGDAILFYRFGDPPELEEVFTQVRRMFSAFHSSLLAYDCRKYCHCQSCVSAVSLTLKVISHYGEFTGYTVSTFNKLIGRDIIVAHELLKNDIEQHEYWLVTHGLLGDRGPTRLADWMEWNPGAKETQAGTVPFQYTLIGQLRGEASAEPPAPPDLSGSTLEISLSRDYETDIITLFHACGDHANRARWQEGVRRVEGVDPHLPRVGMRCRCILDDGEAILRSSGYSYGAERIEFTETNEGTGEVTRYLLEAVAPGRTRLTMEHYLPDRLPGRIRFRLLARERLRRAMERSMVSLAALLPEIVVDPVC